MSDDRLLKALEHANYKAAIVQQQKNLKLRFASDSLHACNGGVFTITPALIAFVDVLLRKRQTEAIIIDDKQTPIKILDLEEFFDDILSAYGETTVAYYTEWQALNKARTVGAVINT